MQILSCSEERRKGRPDTLPTLRRVDGESEKSELKLANYCTGL
jgi:hypothetical protein